jgi:Rps23 Pro-64 3,4-dihydroxylase Tpa1-like proline 4-hydroxylase
MASQSVWYFTDLPKNIIETVEKDLEERYDNNLSESKLHGDVLDAERRHSKNTWIPTYHWISGFLWHYVEMANRENFLYDIRNIDGENLQYAHYGVGEYYKWHNDAGISNLYTPKARGNRGIEIAQDHLNTQAELVRKLSFTLQLSDPEDYEGGQVQFLDENGRTYFAPRRRGTLVLFDSRTQHRVLKVTKGLRKSIVGWVVGPRWK